MKSSRENILARLATATGNTKTLPYIPAFSQTFDFSEAVLGNGSKLATVETEKEIESTIRKYFPKEKVAYFTGETKITDGDPAAIDVAVVRARYGIAENGALWISDEDVPHRSVLFSCEHLVLVLDHNQLVNNLHDFYSVLKFNGYGVLISGPSKTADIGQALVEGAHGARSLLVIL
ncbi:MAG: LUD domain-containing protein, partial [Cyclobacteriaceae bacterium]|nr:LUD domain-containing protein [Cyclobacteriaceae bacterium]